MEAVAGGSYLCRRSMGTCLLLTLLLYFFPIVHSTENIPATLAYSIQSTERTEVSETRNPETPTMLVVAKTLTTSLLPLTTGHTRNIEAQTSKATAETPSHSGLSHLEVQLHLMEQLEASVIARINSMDQQLSEQKGKRPYDSLQARLANDLKEVRVNLHKLAANLNLTMNDLDTVEKDTEEKEKKLEEVLKKQEAEENAHELEERGAAAVDYESGRLKNISTMEVMSDEQRQHFEKVKNEADPAVLHYDFGLLGQIALLFGVSAVGGIVSTSINLPPTVGYLVGGAVVGPSGLGVVHHFKEVETISLFGTIFLLFAHGAEYSLHRSDEVFKLYLISGILYVACTIVSVSLLAVTLGWTPSISEGIIVGAGVCFTSTAPLSEYIRHYNFRQTSFGRLVSAIIAIQDILMSFVLATPEWFAAKSGWITVSVIKTFVAYAAVVVFTVAMHRYVVPSLLEFLVSMEKLHQAPLVLLGIVSVCLFMSLFTETVGLSLECGAFFAGLAFQGSSNLKATLSSIRVLDNLFGSMFFACIGMILNPVFFLRNCGIVFAMMICVCMIKVTLVTSIMSFFQIPFQKSIKAALSLCQVGEVALIFMIKAHATQLVSRPMYLQFLAATSIFLGLSPVLHRNLNEQNTFHFASVLKEKSEFEDDESGHEMLPSSNHKRHNIEHV
ncbi:Transmembrane and coiled-coil domains-containing protein 3 [Aphanomyces cochlioides]|nr:Transmembrane and coiled-coil domains-containing protein 3 [Aphanomyces cochlioides]